ncbi:hypothetical protein R3P38DRAFT_2787480 [Favolaschia claudopus]|uniref:Uncharacterized protein n=1 Tax=Favolaschia claudopus TaxID=2862362 RepID=A0AAW0AN62_9AGAR
MYTKNCPLWCPLDLSSSQLADLTRAEGQTAAITESRAALPLAALAGARRRGGGRGIENGGRKTFQPLNKVGTGPGKLVHETLSPQRWCQARGLGSRASKMDATLSEDLQVRFRAPNVSPTQSRPAATVASRNIQRSASLKSNYVFAFGIEKAKECNINAQECGTFSSPLYKPIVLRVYIWDCLSPLRAQVVSRRRLVLLKVYCKLANRSKEAYSTAWDATNV